ncbi:lysophospholipid acyltransferase family protein [Marinobacter fonticola]|uniref:lysophospholipid acyltransferase family protein n=1 Tax=Marinobacter fonticola TaxID=2603215 RepID=UPI0011E8210A|nr:1-acyl-sn-glycerol-3-phosphate acyltransferase [Marinobacter fonticola]
MQDFDSIRPYRDNETRGVLDRLGNDREFLELIGRFKAPTLTRLTPAITRFWISRWLQKEFGDADTIDALQARLYHFVDQLVHKTTTRVTVSGLDGLDRNKAYLFLSNHRDIVFDPMVVNYLLVANGFRTARIAIGDNLLQNRLFAELMRLNKSFVVKRSMSSPREMRDTYQTLSAFIHHSIDENQSVWIAQREGRAKDGLDITDPAIIKMFYMSQKKTGLSFAESMNNLNIVPVSIAYEYDPCDIPKARELEARARTGSYQKHADEDTDQIMQGLTGYKGHVHVHFGEPISHAPDMAKDLAAQIDADMHRHYHLHASNLIAHDMSQVHQLSRQTEPQTPETVETAEAYTPADLAAAKAELERRLSRTSESFKPFLLAMYANPVSSMLKASVSATSEG